MEGSVPGAGGRAYPDVRTRGSELVPWLLSEKRHSAGVGWRFHVGLTEPPRKWGTDGRGQQAWELLLLIVV